MINLHSNKDKDKVSAWDTTLKLLLSLWYKIKYYTGLFLINHIMRSIVNWYDSRHSNLNHSQESSEEDKLHKLQASLKTKESENYELHLQLDVQTYDNNKLKQQITQLRKSLDAQTESHKALRQNFCDLQRSLDSLKIESNELRKRCLPEYDVPSMIYYAQGDTSGLWLRKISTKISNGHLYKITTLPGDTTKCFFTPITQSNVAEVIANRQVTLLACDIISIASTSSSIELVEEGIAILENNRWKVIQKAKIKLI